MTDAEAALLDRWMERDRRYLKWRRAPWTAAEIAAIRAWRVDEAIADVGSNELADSARRWTPKGLAA